MHKYRINQLFRSLSKEQSDKLEEYYKLLMKWNSKINLISKSSEADADLIHVADAIFGAEIILKDFNSDSILDVGSGNGVPGIIFSILRPDIKVSCLDSDQKKSSFLLNVKTNLKLPNLEVINKRVSDFSLLQKTILARGYAAIDEALNSVEHISSSGTKFYHFKSNEWEKEVSEKCSTWNIGLLGAYKIDLGRDILSRTIIKAVKS